VVVDGEIEEGSVRRVPLAEAVEAVESNPEGDIEEVEYGDEHV
jgi:hypothetical protein